MRRDPFGGRYRQQPSGGRRGINPRFIILLLFAGYGAYYWFSNQSVDPVTGESVLIDRNLSIEEEKALGLQAYEEILSQERPVDPDSPIARQVRGIAERLVAKVTEVEQALAAENGQPAPTFSQSFQWRSTSSSPTRPMRSACLAARWRSTRAWCRWRATRTRWRW